MKKLNKKGFTIVELVIVIAVIAILAAVLIPTFATVISKANESAALQAARNEFTSFLAGSDANTVSGKVGGSYVVNVNNQYYFVIKAGELSKTAYTTATSAETALGSTVTSTTDVTENISGCDTKVSIYAAQ